MYLQSIDTIKIFLKFQKGRVKETLFQTDCRRSSMICGSLEYDIEIITALEKLLHGKTK